MVSHVHRHDEEEIYKKIRDTIDRNDFKSAQHMIDKYRSNIPPDTATELLDYMEKRKKQWKMRKQMPKCRLRTSIWLSAFGKEGIILGLVLLLLVLGFVNLPYLSSFYYHVRSGVGNPTRKLFNDIITLILDLDVIAILWMCSITPLRWKRGDGKGYKWACLIYFIVIFLPSLIRVFTREY